MFPAVTDGTTTGGDPLSHKGFQRSLRQHWGILLPLATLIWIAFFLSDYTNVWVAPEANTWREHLGAPRRSEERRVGKECGCGWAGEQGKQQRMGKTAIL